MTLWLSMGMLFTLAAVVVVLIKWWNIDCIGVTPVSTVTFIAILFTSGLDVGLIMFPLTEFGGYADLAESPEYGFANPLAIEFGFWGFLIWGFYFLTCFYFCIIEPKVKFFELKPVKWVNNAVIIGTCAFTAFLLLVNLPWYLPQLGDGESVLPIFYLIVLACIAAAVYSSSDFKYVRILSLGSSVLFMLLIAMMWSSAFLTGEGSPKDFFMTAALITEYFTNLHHFILPLNDYHEFYLYWWFAWSIMIGQFTARFVSGLKTWQLMLAMLIFPSAAIGTWFTVLYHYHAEDLSISTWISAAMISVGILMVINSLDSLIRLYSENLKLTARHIGTPKYLIGNFIAMCGLTALFQLDFLRIQWVGALVIAIYFASFAYIMISKRKEVFSITGSPPENTLDFTRIEKTT